MASLWDQMLANERDGVGNMFTGVGAELIRAGQGGGPVRPRFDANFGPNIQKAMEAPQRASMFKQQQEEAAHKEKLRPYQLKQAEDLQKKTAMELQTKTIEIGKARSQWDMSNKIREAIGEKAIPFPLDAQKPPVAPMQPPQAAGPSASMFQQPQPAPQQMAQMPGMAANPGPGPQQAAGLPGTVPGPQDIPQGQEFMAQKMKQDPLTELINGMSDDAKAGLSLAPDKAAFLREYAMKQAEAKQKQSLKRQGDRDAFFDLDPKKDFYMKDTPNGPKQTLTRQGAMKFEGQFYERAKPTIDDYQKLNEMANTVMAGLRRRDGTGDIAAITSYIKMIDEGVVRGEEVRLQGSATSIPQWVMTQYNKAKRGDALSDPVRARIAHMVKEIHATKGGIRRSRLEGVKDIVDGTPGMVWNRVIPEKTWNTLTAPLEIPKYITELTSKKGGLPPDARKLNSTPLGDGVGR